MGPQEKAYDVCRDYLSDLPPSVSEDLPMNLLLGWIRSRRFDLLAEAMALYDPALHGVGHFKVLRQVGAFFKKNADFSSESVCRKAALASFIAGEEMCRETNARLDLHYDGSSNEEFRLLADRASAWISQVLGPFSDMSEELPSLIRVTSGATASLSRRKALPYLKVGGRIDCTPRVTPYLRTLCSLWGYSGKRFSETHWNRVEFVPKNWKTYRGIACEPRGNLPLQLAFDTYVKRKLRFVGINLGSQSRNQRLAKEGSITGDLATIDLSMASDTLSRNTVKLLLPEEWYDYLDDVRSPRYQLPQDLAADFGLQKNSGSYHKFSSMGNGATFALETLIFAAACHAVGSRRFSVYGDDIIVESHLSAPLTEFLGYLGFSVNLDKSFSEGPFRESCGFDYYNGIDVTPFYLRSWSERVKPLLSHNINGLVAASQGGVKLWDRCKRLTAEHNLPLVPFSVDSTQGVHIPAHAMYSRDLFRPAHTKRHLSLGVGDQTRAFKAFVSKSPSMRVADSRTLFLWHLQALRDAECEHVSERTCTSVPLHTHKYVMKWVRWDLPAPGSPPYLYGWEAFLARES